MTKLRLHRAAAAGVRRLQPILPELGCLLIVLGAKLWIIQNYGSATPYWDQWDAEAALLYKPYLEGTLRIGDLFAAHNRGCRAVITNLAPTLIFRSWSMILHIHFRSSAGPSLRSAREEASNTNAIPPVQRGSSSANALLVFQANLSKSIEERIHLRSNEIISLRLPVRKHHLLQGQRAALAGSACFNTKLWRHNLFSAQKKEKPYRLCCLGHIALLQVRNHLCIRPGESPTQDFDNLLVA